MRTVKKLVALILACVTTLGTVSLPAHAATTYDVNVVANKADARVRNAFVNYGWTMEQNLDYAYGYKAGLKTVYIKDTQYAYMALGCFVNYHSNPYLAHNTSEFEAWQAVYNDSDEFEKFGRYVRPAVSYIMFLGSAEQYFHSVFFAYSVQPATLKSYCPKAYNQMDIAVKSITEKTAILKTQI